MPDDLRGGADVIIIEIKCTMNAMHWNHPDTIIPTPSPPQFMGKYYLPRNGSLVPKGLGTTTALKPRNSVLLTASSPMVKAGFADHTDLSFDPM